MEFTPELTTFQGVLLSANRIHPFSKITAKGGNEEQVEYVLNNVLSFLRNENYLDQSNAVNPMREDTMRKFAVYLVLNSDFICLEPMSQMEGTDYIATIPAIPKYLLSEMLWNLHMNKFVYEIIAFSNPQLSVELTSCLIANVKYLTPFTSINHLKVIAGACYRLLCRLHFYTIDTGNLSSILIQTYNSFEKCINYFVTPPNEEKLAILNIDDGYRHKGNCLHTVLSLVIECLNHYSSRQNLVCEDFNEIHLLTFPLDMISTNPSKKQIRSEKILECLNKCNMFLLDKCKDLVMDVTVDIFCAWSEFAPQNEENMQKAIGEMCYKLREKLMSINSVAEHSLITMIQEICIKPVCFEEIVNSTDSQTIIANIMDNEHREEWIHALIHRKNLCHDTALIEHLSANLEVLKPEECYTLFQICQAFIKEHSEDNVSNLELLTVKLFKQCVNDTKFQILDIRFHDFLYDMKETEDFNNDMTKLFNKLIAESDSDMFAVLDLFLQNPQKVYTKLFILASESINLSDLMIRIMKMLQKYAKRCYSNETAPCIIGIITKVLNYNLDTESKQTNFIHFMSLLKFANIFSDAQILLQIIMPNLHNALMNRDVSGIDLQFRLIEACYSVRDLCAAYRAPLLVMIAQVLQVVRWKINTFTPTSPTTLSNVLDLQCALFGTYGDRIPDNEAAFLKNKLARLKLQPANLFYYRKLLSNAQAVSFTDTVTKIHVKLDTNLQMLSCWLCVVICSCTRNEWCRIWEDLRVLPDAAIVHVFTNMMIVVTKSEFSRRTDSTYDCLLHCYKNYVYVIRYKFFKEPLSNTYVAIAIHRIASALNFVADVDVENISTIMIPLFTYLVQRRADYNVDIPFLMQRYLKKPRMLEAIGKVYNINNSTTPV